MHRKWNFSVARLASAFITLSIRFKSTKARPSAPLGSRILTSPDDIFKHNMWDHVQWTKEDEENARQRAEENSSVQLPLTDQGKFDTGACQYWDKFYEVHQDKFFKDRHWLFLEFPELLPSWMKEQSTITGHDHQRPENLFQARSGADAEMGPHQHKDPTPTHRSVDHTYFQKEAQEQNEAATQNSSYPGHQASFRILEVGCGVGNSVFPIVNNIKETNSFLYCCDFSPRAIQLVKAHPDYDDSVCHAFVHDICEDVASFPFPPLSLDVILAVFVLSSIHPDRMQGVVERLSANLKPGGIFLFRDYGRYDLSQLRFKKGRCLSENFYTRGDGTCVYFFTKEEVHDLFSKTGLEEIQNLEDKRLQVNRGKKVVMRRVWMQSKFRKPQPS
ncbi:mRNA N(3)-methylcytidine methyltransferase METTL8 [Cololabis saira]|uniref:mRNA N(3)-methylcytidine methyltransferase METTL8 n=1 Tax=Cololabis saira TaxID=129043 RepID=UPI002AD571D9|nr:mRNA N(3)-methylcytidine methyltransferase METTL8 [Cololabis saira]XP_061579521.1 mRNA N(3)-methylcytidine methyltransferase METTL8 [Cololabis saira]